MCLGVPAKLVEVFQRDGLPMGKVELGGISKEICLAYTPEAQIGDYLLIHVGFAISRLEEDESQEIFSFLEQLEASDTAESPPSQPDYPKEEK